MHQIDNRACKSQKISGFPLHRKKPAISGHSPRCMFVIKRQIANKVARKAKMHDLAS